MAINIYKIYVFIINQSWLADVQLDISVIRKHKCSLQLFGCSSKIYDNFFKNVVELPSPIL